MVCTNVKHPYIGCGTFAVRKTVVAKYVDITIAAIFVDRFLDTIFKIVVRFLVIERRKLLNALCFQGKFFGS